MTAGWGDKRLDRLSQKEKGLMDMDNSVVNAGGKGGRCKRTKWNWKKIQ